MDLGGGGWWVGGGQYDGSISYTIILSLTTISYQILIKQLEY